MAWTLVTGGGKRLGAEICRQLALSGYNLVIHYRTSFQEASEVAAFCRRAGVRAELIQGDFTTRDSTLQFVEKYLKQFSATQNLINNVGNYLLGAASQTSLDNWYDLFQNNLHAPFIIINGLLESIKKEKGGIINLGAAGLNQGRADTYSTAYRCAKMSLWMLTKSLAKELAPFLVSVNMISPGYLENSVDLPSDPASLPMGRPASLSEAAALIEFLLSPKGKYITGQNIELAGGVQLSVG